MSYAIVEKGSPCTFDYKIFFVDDNGFISPFHDIPLFANEDKSILNMVVEIPRWTNAKMEISKEDKLNPIKQDVKKGKLRFVDNCFPHHGYIWNYGALPQTWEDPNYTDHHTGQKGDNDPIDVCEIGSKVQDRGGVIRVKVLGILALIDEDETDWKVLAIDVTDPLASSLNDISDVELYMPGLLQATTEWFRIYKIPTGKPENKFAFDGEVKNVEFANTIIARAHEHWNHLVSKKTESGSLSCVNTTLTDSPHLIGDIEAKDFVDSIIAEDCAKSAGAGVPDDVNKWHFVTPTNEPSPIYEEPTRLASLR